MAKDDAEPPAAPGLFHPVYLDVPMMISFLALRDGVAFEDTTTRRDSQTTSRERERSARVRRPSLGSLLGFDASGRMKLLGERNWWLPSRLHWLPKFEHEPVAIPDTA